MDKLGLVAALVTCWLKKIFSGFEMRILLIVLACFLVGGFPPATSAAQKEFPQEWVTPAVSAPHLVQRFFHSSAANTDVSYHVYTPESYDADKERRFPVIYWLHGFGEPVKEMPQVVEYFDRAMREGKIPPALVVFPNGMVGSMWCNSKDGKIPMETVVIKELVPQIDATLRTIPSRAGRLIEGFSMGGYGAARLGFKYPEIFGAISMLGAGPMQLKFNASTGPSRLAPVRSRVLQSVYGGDQAYFRALSPWVLAEQNAKALSKSTVRIEVGDRDDMRSSNEEFAARLSSLRIPHTFHLIKNVDHHPMRLFQAMGEANWDFYRAALDGKASAADGKTRDYTIESGQRHDAAPEKIHPAQSNMQRQRMIERLRQFDYDGDGVIHLRDLPPPALARFKQLDTNRDSRIDASELSNFLR